MKWLRTTQWLMMAAVVVSGLLATACSSYFKVTDPTSGNIYYTEKVNRGVGGAVSFMDAASGSEVTIQNSQVKEISEKEFDVGRYAPIQKAPSAPPAPAAPAPAAPTPAPAPAAPESAPAPEGGSATE